MVRHAITIICLFLAVQAPAQVPRNVMDWLSVAAQDGGGTIPQDYIAYWSFDTDASDATGNYSATATNNTPTFVSSGGVGNRGYVSCDSNPSWDFFTIPTVSMAIGGGIKMSVSIWINYNGFTLMQLLFGLSAGGNNYLSINDRYDPLRVYTGVAKEKTTTVARYPSGWHHWVFLIGDNVATGVYFDGKAVSTLGGNFGYEAMSWNLLLKHYGNIGFRGFADELYLYDRELTPTEITGIYNAEQP